ncbi:UDP-N-acetylmuramate dehydrogenase [Corynebacterium sp. H128]|uniref:UDP-N-acetylmuramate dehydrogenase n=2 Tax=Corynebacterium sp. H128 TaxID=3133427 RepID=UPI0030A4A68B
MHDLLMTQKLAEIRPEIDRIAGLELREMELRELTTLHLGGRPLLTARCLSQDAATALITLLDAHSLPLLVIGGGSNLVVADGDLNLVAVVLAFQEISSEPETGMIRAEAGAVWDDVVLHAVEAGLGGIECLSGIPGSAGAVPVQNVGAYGTEISSVLTRVKLLERTTGVVEWVPAEQLELAYRYSNLKFTGRAVVLEIELRLTPGGMSAPLRFGELARTLGASESGERRPVADVREAVLQLRRGKGMVFEESDHDTWSAGSFFTNPAVDNRVADYVRRVSGEADMPCFPIANTDQSKLSAAWLIERAGFPKGFPGGDAPATLSTKHTLALTNRGSASAADLVDLARTIRAGVLDKFGVQLEPEPVWIAMEIDED